MLLALQARQLCVLQLHARRLFFFFNPFPFPPKPGISILRKKGRVRRKSQWDQARKARRRGRSLRTHSAPTGCRGNPARPVIRGEMESLPQQLLSSGRSSPHFLACALPATTRSGRQLPLLISGSVGVGRTTASWAAGRALLSPVLVSASPPPSLASFFLFLPTSPPLGKCEAVGGGSEQPQAAWG